MEFANVADYECQRVCRSGSHCNLNGSASVPCNCSQGCVNCRFRILPPICIYCLPWLSFYTKLWKNKRTVLNKKHFKVVSLSSFRNNFFVSRTNPLQLIKNKWILWQYPGKRNIIKTKVFAVCLLAILIVCSSVYVLYDINLRCEISRRKRTTKV
jgi:hypothetical protein